MFSEIHILDIAPDIARTLPSICFSSLVLFFLWIRDGRRWSRQELVEFVKLISIATAILGSASLIQPFLFELLSPPPLAYGFVYFFEFYTFSTITRAIEVVVISGLPPAVVLIILLLRTKFGATLLFAALAAILVLTVYDLILFLWQASLERAFNLQTILSFAPKLGLAIIVNVLGGSIAGGIIYIKIKQAKVYELRRTQQLKTVSTKRLRIYLCAAFLFPIAFYLIFVRTLPIRIAVDLEKYKEATIQLKSHFGLDSYLLNPNLNTIGNSNLNTVGNSSNILIEHLLVQVNPRPELKLRITAMGGCINAKDALAEYSSLSQKPEPFPIDYSRIEIKGSRQTLNIIQPADDRDLYLALGMPNAQSLLSIGNLGTENFKVVHSANANLEFNAVAGTTIIVGTEDIYHVTRRFPGGHMLAWDGSAQLAIYRNDSSLGFRLDGGERNKNRIFCRYSFLSNKQEDNPWRSSTHFVIEVINSTEFSKFFTKLPHLILDTHEPGILGKEQTFATDVRAQVSDGHISAGNYRNNLTRGDELLIRSPSLELVRKPTGTLEITGSAQYLFLNGNRLHETIWSTIEVEIRVVLLTAIFALCGWMGRNRLIKLSRILKRM